jgi:Coenzyme PQQ synthesis protein D (PqqD)
MLDSSTVVKRSAGQVSCVLNDEVAVLNLDRALYFGLKGVAAHIWDLLQEPRSVAEICDDVTAQFDVASDVCRADVSSFVLSLCNAGLVEIVG